MKLAIITGASRGIGQQTAELFLEHGWQVIGLSRTAPPYPAILHIPVDLNHFDIQQFEPVWIEQLKKATQICFIHCAGIITPDSIERFDTNVFQHMFQVNVLSAIKLSQFLIPFMPKRSSIILVGSTLSYIGVPESCSYIISKHALLGLMHSLTYDLAHREIHTCCVCPGFVETEMIQELAVKRQCDMNDFKSIQLFNRFIQPEEIANLIYFCAENPVINGGMIQANQGQNR
jgi:NAD(P)-dependent dehydrogenase (short-subunit alcohol dehydrogenase family)